MTAYRAFARVLAAVLVPFALAGCASPLAPDRAALRDPEPSIAQPIGNPAIAGAKGGFYPLRLGNRWDYGTSVTMTIVTPGSPPPLPGTWLGTMHRELICTERVGRHEYFVEQGLVLYDNGRSVPQWIRYRQDANGLFEADLSLSAAPACATVSPAGSEGPPSATSEIARLTRGSDERVRTAFEAAAIRLETRRRQIETMARSMSLASAASAAIESSPELVRLSYPLVVGRRWFIRTDPPFEAVVEANEIHTVPAGRFQAWRIQIVPPGPGPRDRVHVWYGRAGYLGLDAHFEMEATDASGNVVGIAIAEQREMLTGYGLKGSTRIGPENLIP